VKRFVGVIIFKKTYGSVVSNEIEVKFGRIILLASIDGVEFWYDVILSRWRPVRPLLYTQQVCSSLSRLPTSPPSARVVTSSLYALYSSWPIVAYIRIFVSKFPWQFYPKSHSTLVTSESSLCRQQACLNFRTSVFLRSTITVIERFIQHNALQQIRTRKSRYRKDERAMRSIYECPENCM